MGETYLNIIEGIEEKMTENKINPVTHGNELTGHRKTIHFHSIINNKHSQSLERDCK